jgi:hypothetical protein
LPPTSVESISYHEYSGKSVGRLPVRIDDATTPDP